MATRSASQFNIITPPTAESDWSIGIPANQLTEELILDDLSDLERWCPIAPYDVTRGDTQEGILSVPYYFIPFGVTPGISIRINKIKAAFNAVNTEVSAFYLLLFKLTPGKVPNGSGPYHRAPEGYTNFYHMRMQRVVCHKIKEYDEPIGDGPVLLDVSDLNLNIDLPDEYMRFWLTIVAVRTDNHGYVLPITATYHPPEQDHDINAPTTPRQGCAWYAYANGDVTEEDILDRTTVPDVYAEHAHDIWAFSNENSWYDKVGIPLWNIEFTAFNTNTVQDTLYSDHKLMLSELGAADTIWTSAMHNYVQYLAVPVDTSLQHYTSFTWVNTESSKWLLNKYYRNVPYFNINLGTPYVSGDGTDFDTLTFRSNDLARTWSWPAENPDANDPHVHMKAGDRQDQSATIDWLGWRNLSFLFDHQAETDIRCYVKDETWGRNNYWCDRLYIDFILAYANEYRISYEDAFNILKTTDRLEEAPRFLWADVSNNVDNYVGFDLVTFGRLVTSTHNTVLLGDVPAYDERNFGPSQVARRYLQMLKGCPIALGHVNRAAGGRTTVIDGLEWILIPGFASVTEAFLGDRQLYRWGHLDPALLRNCFIIYTGGWTDTIVESWEYVQTLEEGRARFATLLEGARVRLEALVQWFLANPNKGHRLYLQTPPPLGRWTGFAFRYAAVDNNIFPPFTFKVRCGDRITKPLSTNIDHRYNDSYAYGSIAIQREVGKIFDFAFGLRLVWDRLRRVFYFCGVPQDLVDSVEIEELDGTTIEVFVKDIQLNDYRVYDNYCLNNHDQMSAMVRSIAKKYNIPLLDVEALRHAEPRIIDGLNLYITTPFGSTYIANAADQAINSGMGPLVEIVKFVSPGSTKAIISGQTTQTASGATLSPVSVKCFSCNRFVHWQDAQTGEVISTDEQLAYNSIEDRHQIIRAIIVKDR